MFTTWLQTNKQTNKETNARGLLARRCRCDSDEPAQHFGLGKSHIFSCAPDGVRTRVTDVIES